MTEKLQKKADRSLAILKRVSQRYDDFIKRHKKIKTYLDAR